MNESNPLDRLNTDFGHINHGIKTVCVSKTHEENSGTDIKYMVCDCSTDEKNKVLTVGFLGTDNKEDVLNE